MRTIAIGLNPITSSNLPLKIFPIISPTPRKIKARLPVYILNASDHAVSIPIMNKFKKEPKQVWKLIELYMIRGRAISIRLSTNKFHVFLKSLGSV